MVFIAKIARLDVGVDDRLSTILNQIRLLSPQLHRDTAGENFDKAVPSSKKSYRDHFLEVTVTSKNNGRILL